MSMMPGATPVRMKTREFYMQQVEFLSQYVEQNVEVRDAEGKVVIEDGLPKTEKRFDPGLHAMLLMIELLSDLHMLTVQIAARPDHCHVPGCNTRGAVSMKHPLMI